MSKVSDMTFDEWIDQQEDGIAACDHVTFGRKVWYAAQADARSRLLDFRTVFLAISATTEHDAVSHRCNLFCARCASDNAMSKIDEELWK